VFVSNWLLELAVIVYCSFAVFTFIVIIVYRSYYYYYYNYYYHHHQHHKLFVSLLAMFGTSQRLAFVPLTNTILLLGAPMQPTWWVKILTYLQLERFLFIIFYNLVFTLSIIVKAVVYNPYFHVLCSF
jgi:hypothetical protein